MANLMGFKKVDRIPVSPSGRSHGLYDDLVRKVQETGDIYGFDTKDQKRTKTMIGTIRVTIKRLKADDVEVIQRGTAIYVRKRSDA